MKILIGSLVIFFGTLLAAGLVALGRPGAVGLSVPQQVHAGTLPSSTTAASSEPDWDDLFATRGLR